MTARRIYSISHPSEEVRAVAAAKCSRSPEPFDEILKSVDEDKAGEFHSKWTIGYGHASVADMAIPQYALENISILATKLIESFRRGAFQEKSTRYQKITRDSVYMPTLEEAGSSFVLDQYRAIVNNAFDAYERLRPAMTEYAEKKIPKDAPLREAKARNLVFDSLRYFLPCGTLTNMSFRLSGRDIATLTSILRAHRFPEFQAIGDEIHAAASKELPTLLRHADKSEWLEHLTDACSHILDGEKRAIRFENRPGACLTCYDTDAELRVLGAMVYKGASLNGMHIPYDVCMNLISRNRHDWVEKLEAIMAKRGDHDSAPEAFEATHYTFDVMMDYGAYRDLQRHRRCTQIPQEMDFRLGFATPEDIVDAGLKDDYQWEMDNLQDKVQSLDSRSKILAQYATPLAFYHRCLHIYDLAEAYYVIELRSKPQCALSYRRIVTDMFNEIKRVHPLLAQWIRITPIER